MKFSERIYKALRVYTNDRHNLCGRSREGFFGNFGLKDVGADYMMLVLDDFDKKFYAEDIANLKEGEMLCRYVTDKTDVHGWKIIMKVNPSQAKVWFNVNEDPNSEALVFEKKATYPIFMNVVLEKMGTDFQYPTYCEYHN